MQEALCFKLQSGNTFFYLKKIEGEFLQAAFVCSENLELLGGFLGLEADRKFKAFSSLPNIGEVKELPKTSFYQIFNMLKKEQFAEQLGAVSQIFLDLSSHLTNESEVMAESIACMERQDYFAAMGLEMLERDFRAQYSPSLLIANHLSVVSKDYFRSTFYSGYSGFESDEYTHHVTRYSNCYYKAPAYYLRKLANRVF